MTDQPATRLPRGKREQLTRILRERIISGAWALGSRLPSNVELRREFQCSMDAVLGAVKLLIVDGFLTTRDRVGTFVSLTPPHLDTFGVLFSGYPLTVPSDGTFWTQFAYHSLAMQQSGQYRLQLYFGITGHSDDVDYQRALADLDAHRIAGLLFVSTLAELRHTPLVTRPSVPRMTLFGMGDDTVPHLAISDESFYEQALHYFAQRGRSRVAVIGGPDYLSSRAAQLETQIRTHGLTTEQRLIISTQPTPYARQSLLRTACYFMMQSAERPDALIIMDDNFVAHTLGGIMEAGLRLGDEVDVVAHCSYPLRMTDQWPIQRLGYSIPEVFTLAWQLLQQQREGHTIPMCTVVTPRFLGDDTQ